MDDTAGLLEAARDAYRRHLDEGRPRRAALAAVASEAVAEAGFGEVTVHEAPGDPLNAVFVTSRPAA